MLEGELQGGVGRKRMNKEVAKLKDHYIVCGFGKGLENPSLRILTLRLPRFRTCV